MNYASALDYIESLSPTSAKPCLERMALFMDEHGRIQDRFQTIHVTGTNGKGSTVAALDSMLRACGIRVGRYSGPHLLRWNERFHVDGKPISDEEFARQVTCVRKLSEAFGERHPELGHLTWFELLTAIAFFYFAESKVQTAIIEVGLGGRWDATNVLTKPLCSVITNVDLDHTHILGYTVSEIASEKAGILKPGVPVITAAEGDALDVIRKVAHQTGSPIVECKAPDSVTTHNENTFTINKDLLKSAMSGMKSFSLLGQHQQTNALLACAALASSGFNDTLSQQYSGMKEGLSNVKWPGRMQYLPALHLLLDGAHNPAGAKCLRSSFDELFAPAKPLFILGLFENKDVDGLIHNLVRENDRVFACQVDTKRPVCPAKTIARISQSLGAKATIYDTIASALSRAFAQRTDNEVIVVTGSFATIKETMLYLGWNSVEDSYAEKNSPATKRVIT